MILRCSTPVRDWKCFKGLMNLVNLKLKGFLLTSEHTCDLPSLSVTLSDLKEAKSLMLRNDLLAIQSSLPFFIGYIAHDSFCFH